MSRQIERLERGLYLMTCEGTITRGAIFECIRERDVFIRQYNDERYALILDLSNVTVKEYDIRSARRALEDSHMIAMFVINPPAVIQMTVKILRQLSQVTLEVNATYDEALEHARAAIAG
jgi:hypothetical protein